MQRYNSEGHNTSVKPQNKISLCPTPLAFVLPQGSTGISQGLAESLNGQWPPKGWKIMDSNHPDDASLADYYGSLPEGHSLGYIRNNPTGYVVPVDGFRMPLSPPAERGVPPTRQPLSIGVPDFGFGIHDSSFEVPKTPQTMTIHNFGKHSVPPDQGMMQEHRQLKAIASSSNAKKKDKAKLLEGFTVIEEVRKGGRSIGHKDKYYIHMETGKKLRSLGEVERFKLTGNPKKTKPTTTTSTSEEDKASTHGEIPDKCK